MPSRTKVAPVNGDDPEKPWTIEAVLYRAFFRLDPEVSFLGKLLWVVFYTPIGCMLFLLRISVWGMSRPLLNIPGLGKHITRCQCSPSIRLLLFGLFVRVRGRKNLKVNGPRILVCNHNTNFDPLLLWASLSHHVLVGTGDAEGFWRQCTEVGFLGDVICTSNLGSQEARAEVRRKIAEAVAAAEHPLLIFPEGCVQPCDRILFRFDKYAFSLGATVMPVTLKLVYPWPIRHYKCHGNVILNFLYLLFVPFIIAHVEVLEPMSIEEHESPEKFSARVQSVIGARLGLQCSRETWISKDIFLQAVGLQPYDEWLWARARKEVGAERIAIRMRLEEGIGDPQRTICQAEVQIREWLLKQLDRVALNDLLQKVKANNVQGRSSIFFDSFTEDDVAGRRKSEHRRPSFIGALGRRLSFSSGDNADPPHNQPRHSSFRQQNQAATSLRPTSEASTPSRVSEESSECTDRLSGGRAKGNQAWQEA